VAVVTLTVREAIKRAGAAYERGQLDQAALISNLDGLAAAGLSGADAAPAGTQQAVLPGAAVKSGAATGQQRGTPQSGDCERASAAPHMSRRAPQGCRACHRLDSHWRRPKASQSRQVLLGVKSARALRAA
jgi:hypothetical protein